MTFGSLFSGCGLMDTAVERAGFRPTFQVEKDATCRSILKRHWPEVERPEDVRDFGICSTVHRPRLLAGGFPCTSVSVAGQRAGFAGASGLWHEFRRCIAEFSAEWVLIENVPGLLSGCGCPLCCCVAVRMREHLEREQRRNKMARDCGCGECEIGRRLHQAHSGRNFAIVIAGLVELGYGIAWRILDAQWFGLAQRRRRVFIVGCLGNVRRASQVLFESDCVPWHPTPSREKRTRVAGTLEARTGAGGFPGTGGACGEHIVHTLRGEGFDASEDGTGRGTPLVAACLRSNAYNNSDPTMEAQMLVATHTHTHTQQQVCHALSAKGGRFDPNGEDFVVNCLDSQSGGVDDNAAAAHISSVGESKSAYSGCANGGAYKTHNQKGGAGSTGIRRLTPL